MSPAPLPPPRPAPDEGAGSLPAGPLRVLAFGWEFAPILSGGLGVACAGLVRALVAEGTRVTFVLPKMPAPVEVDGVRLCDAREVARRDAAGAGPGLAAGAAPTPVRLLETRPFASPLGPYQDPAGYAQARGEAATGPGRAAHAAATVPPAPPPPGDASLYGGDLFAEVQRLSAAAARLAAEIPHDVIHCHDWMTFAAGIAAREVSGRPLVLHVHSTEGDRSGGAGGNAAIRDLEGSGLRAADRVVAVSEFTRRRILEQYDVDPDRVLVVHNGIEPPARGDAEVELPALAGDRPVVLFLGRLTAQKGPEWFLEAAARVHAVRPEVLFVVAGSGEMLPWMVERAAGTGLASNVLFTGFLSGEDIERAYAMADVFVMPSVSEPFGLVPVEAMLRGTPAIVSRQSGVSEVIRHCLKVDFWDSEDLADKIVAVLDHPSLAASLSGAGRREALRLGWQEPARRLLAVFDGLVAGAGAEDGA